MSSMDFNGADSQDAAFDLIPPNTFARVRLTIRPGGAGPEGWLTQSKTSTALYLNTEAVILDGPHARRRVYTRIGFKGKAVNERGEDTYANRGRSLIRGILESARGVRSADESEQAKAARMIGSLGDLNGLECVAKIGVDKDKDNSQDSGRNVITAAIGPEHPQYTAIMGDARPAPVAPTAAGQGTPQVAENPSAAPAVPAGSAAPFWAR